jgi:hypothetical protein
MREKKAQLVQAQVLSSGIMCLEKYHTLKNYQDE